MKLLARECGNPSRLAQLLEVSDRTVRKWLLGTEPARQYLERMADRMNVNVEWLVTGKGSMRSESTPAAFQDYVRIPLYNVRGAAGDGAFVESEAIETLLAFSRTLIRAELRANPANLSLIYVSGDSMVPTLHPGDMVLVDRSEAASGTDGIYVLRRNGYLQIKRVQWLSTHSVKLVSDNPIYEPVPLDLGEQTEDLQLIGRVIWVGKRF